MFQPIFYYSKLLISSFDEKTSFKVAFSFNTNIFDKYPIPTNNRTEKVILRVQNTVLKEILPNMELVNIMPIDFTIYENGSEIEKVKDPKNKICDRLGIRAMLVTIPKSTIISFVKVVESAGVEVVDLVLSPIADFEEIKELWDGIS